MGKSRKEKYQRYIDAKRRRGSSARALDERPYRRCRLAPASPRHSSPSRPSKTSSSRARAASRRAEPGDDDRRGSSPGTPVERNRPAPPTNRHRHALYKSPPKPYSVRDDEPGGRYQSMEDLRDSSARNQRPKGPDDRYHCEPGRALASTGAGRDGSANRQEPLVASHVVQGAGQSAWNHYESTAADFGGNVPPRLASVHVNPMRFPGCRPLPPRPSMCTPPRPPCPPGPPGHRLRPRRLDPPPGPPFSPRYPQGPADLEPPGPGWHAVRCSPPEPPHYRGSGSEYRRWDLLPYPAGHPEGPAAERADRYDPPERPDYGFPAEPPMWYVPPAHSDDNLASNDSRWYAPPDHSHEGPRSETPRWSGDPYYSGHADGNAAEYKFHPLPCPLEHSIKPRADIFSHHQPPHDSNHPREPPAQEWHRPPRHAGQTNPPPEARQNSLAGGSTPPLCKQEPADEAVSPYPTTPKRTVPHMLAGLMATPPLGQEEFGSSCYRVGTSGAHPRIARPSGVYESPSSRDEAWGPWGCKEPGHNVAFGESHRRGCSYEASSSHKHGQNLSQNFIFKESPESPLRSLTRDVKPDGSELLSPLGCVLVRGGEDGGYERHSLVLHEEDVGPSQGSEVGLRDSCPRKSANDVDLRLSLSRILDLSVDALRKSEPTDLRDMLSRKSGVSQPPVEDFDLRVALSRKPAEKIDLREAPSRKSVEEADLREVLSRKHVAEVDLRENLNRSKPSAGEKGPPPATSDAHDFLHSSTPSSGSDDLRSELTRRRETHTPREYIVEEPATLSDANAETKERVDRVEFNRPECGQNSSRELPTEELHDVASALKEYLEDYEAMEVVSHSPFDQKGSTSLDVLISRPVSLDLFPFRQRAKDFFDDVTHDSSETYENLTSKETCCNAEISPKLQESFIDVFLASIRKECEKYVEDAHNLENTKQEMSSENIKCRLRKRTSASHIFTTRKKSSIRKYGMISKAKKVESRKLVMAKIRATNRGATPKIEEEFVQEPSSIKQKQI